MKLKKIEIFGFKSFADKATLDFHEGITCVVGPNGCGKSNIADAMRWVFGEQSAKSMRCGSKMTDVIFAGTTVRKSLNFAEVTITFNEIQQALPLDYEEIAVTRRLYRSGESDYFINRQSVRLKDIQNLFLDSGVGQSAFSIFEQGKIDQLIQLSPTERRSIFEKAAGIERYLLRKKESLHKYKLVDDNLDRVKDIHAEVEKQIVVLEDQAKKAKVYQEEKKRLEDLEKGLLFYRLCLMRQTKEEILTEKHAFESSFEEHEQLFAESEKQVSQERRRLSELEEAYLFRNEQLHLARTEVKVLKEKGQANFERIKELSEREKEGEKALFAIQHKRAGWTKEIATYNAEKELLQTRILKQQEIFNAKEKLFQAFEKELSLLRDQQIKSHQEKLKNIQLENQLESELKTHRIRLENHQEKKEHLEERFKRLSLISEELTDQEVKKQNELKQQLARVDALKEEMMLLEKEILEFHQKIDESFVRFESIKKELNEFTARQNALTRLKEDHEGFSVDSKKILAQSQMPGSPIFGLVKKLYEQFSADPGFELSLSLALKAYTETLVVESEQDLFSVLKFAKENQLQDFSVFCLQYLTNPTDSKTVKGLSSKVAKTKLTQHFLEKILFSEDCASAFILNAPSVVQEAFFIDHLRVLHCGVSHQSGFLREGELKELAKQIRKSDLACKEAGELLKNLNQSKTALADKRQELDKKSRSQEMQLVEANFGLRKVQTDLEKAKKEQSQVTEEIEGSDLTIAQLLQLQLELQLKLNERKAKTFEVDQNHVSMEKDLESKFQSRTVQLDELQKSQEALRSVTDEFRKVSHALNLLEVTNQESLSSSAKIEEELKKNCSLKAFLVDEEAKGKERGTSYQRTLKEEEEKTAKLQAEIKESKASLEKKGSTHRQLQACKKEIEDKLTHAKIRHAQIETSLTNTRQELEVRFNLNYDEAKIAIEPLKEPADKVEKEVKRLRLKTESTQDVNLAAIEDYDKQKARYQFLEGQLADLEASKQELQSMITGLDEESRVLFKDTFIKIRENFRKNFAILFNGGEADLELIESEDVLEAGIEIIAKPPGKKMRLLSLLSGGEKCLTAMALLFSIFEVKAAPFCILDEIDAPLDDSNVNRFGDVVKQFIDRCQFIIITHNKSTMTNVADRLVGVSMQEKGVSKLLKMEFAKGNKKSLEV